MGDPGGIPGPWYECGPGLTVTAIWGENSGYEIPAFPSVKMLLTSL